MVKLDLDCKVDLNPDSSIHLFFSLDNCVLVPVICQALFLALEVRSG